LFTYFLLPYFSFLSYEKFSSRFENTEVTYFLLPYFYSNLSKQAAFLFLLVLNEPTAACCLLPAAHYWYLLLTSTTGVKKPGEPGLAG